MADDCCGRFFAGSFVGTTSAEARHQSQPNRDLAENRLCIPAQYLASMPAQVLLPLRPTDFQAQITITARRVGGASDSASLEHGAAEKAGIQSRPLQRAVR